MMSVEGKAGKKIKAQIHCPVNGCVYFSGSERFFTEKKFLNQHIAKVHAEKKYPCNKCNKSFGMDWWRKHHEKTCGMEWKCHCGVKYTSRETLQTHCRRSNHKLPESVIGDKMKQNKNSKKSNDNPVIVLIQPIIQNLTCIQPVQNSALSPQPILPKAMHPLKLPLPVSTDARKNICSPTYISSLTHNPTENFVFSHISPNHNSDTLTNPFLSTPKPSTEMTSDNQKQSVLCTTATQTTDSFEYLHKTCESRASQCSRRKSKTAAVGIESIHTQTAESTVVKIKKKRSRRKSVAITTESSMLSGPGMNIGHSVWSDFSDLIIPNSENSNHRAFKNCASTQTSNSKILCDSQTLTDDELLKMVFDHTVKKDSNDNCHAPFDMLPDLTSTDPIAMMQDNSMLNMFSSDGAAVDSILSSNVIQNHTGIAADNVLMPSQSATDEGLSKQTSSIFPSFSDCMKQDIGTKAPPTLSDIHTQTMASNLLDYNLLANMETQTTDDFTLYDLEFSDTETQTPWEDFPNIDDSLLQADQLSIEIQTDFPSLNTDYQYAYDFINGLNMCTEGPTKETLGVNTETQTYDRFTFPQFTNSECQTLDLSDFVFPSQTD